MKRKRPQFELDEVGQSPPMDEYQLVHWLKRVPRTQKTADSIWDDLVRTYDYRSTPEKAGETRGWSHASYMWLVMAESNAKAPGSALRSGIPRMKITPMREWDKADLEDAIELLVAELYDMRLNPALRTWTDDLRLCSLGHTTEDDPGFIMWAMAIFVQIERIFRSDFPPGQTQTPLLDIRPWLEKQRDGIVNNQAFLKGMRNGTMYMGMRMGEQEKYAVSQRLLVSNDPLRIWEITRPVQTTGYWKSEMFRERPLREFEKMLPRKHLRDFFTLKLFESYMQTEVGLPFVGMCVVFDFDLWAMKSSVLLADYPVIVRFLAEWAVVADGREIFRGELEDSIAVWINAAGDGIQTIDEYYDLYDFLGNLNTN